MAILFYSLLFILPKWFLVSSLTLDIHYPEYDKREQYYQQYPYRSPNIQNPNQFPCECYRPCQCSDPSPPKSVYYPSSVFRSPPKPIERPVIIPPSPPIFSPGANVRPAPLAQGMQTFHDETKYNAQNLAHTHTQNIQTPIKLESTIQSTAAESKYESKNSSSSNMQAQQTAGGIISSVQTTQDNSSYAAENHTQSHTQTNHSAGLITRRQSSQPYSPIYQSPTYYQRSQHPHGYRYIRSDLSPNSPILQVHNINNGVKMGSNRGPGSIFLRGRDPRCTMESSEIQNGNDVASQSSIITSKNSPTSQIDNNSIRNKRAPQKNPLAWGRGITKGNYTIVTDQKNFTPTLYNNSTQYHIVVPSRKLVSNSTDNPTSNNNNESSKFNGNIGITDKPITEGLISNARSSEYRGVINYLNGYPVYRGYIRQQRPVNSMPTSALQAFYPG